MENDEYKDALGSPNISEKDRKLAEKFKKRYDAGMLYKQSQGYLENWNKADRFWNADQWPDPTSQTKDFPRPVTNHFAEIVEQKVAGLTYEAPDIFYEPVEVNPAPNATEIPVIPLTGEEKDAFTVTVPELLATVVKNLAEKLELEQLLDSGARTAALMGTGIWFYHWDNTVIGGGQNTGYIGDIVGMEIDPADIFVGDPSQPDIQKQPWIIVSERRPRKQVREEYRKYTDLVDYLREEAPQSRAQTYEQQKIEMQETDYVDLLHCWEREWYTSKVEIGGEEIEREMCRINYYVVCQSFVLREEKDFYPYSNLYPFAKFDWYPKRKSFFGKPESADLINNQRELNLLQGISLLGAYQTGLPNIRIRNSFVKKEDVPVGPGGKIIKDSTPPAQGWSIDYMQPPNIAPYIPLLERALEQGMKETSGMHEAIVGKAPSAQLNASAIIALQEAAGVRIRGIQRRMYQAVRDMGLIWLGFIKQHYSEQRAYKVTGRNNVEGVVWFQAQMIEGMEFNVKVSGASASPYSKTVIATTLENMLERGVIDGELYLRMLPVEVFPKVKELLEMVELRQLQEQQKAIEEQLIVMDGMIQQLVTKAAEAGVPITPDTLQVFQQMMEDYRKEAAA